MVKVWSMRDDLQYLNNLRCLSRKRTGKKSSYNVLGLPRFSFIPRGFTDSRVIVVDDFHYFTDFL